MNIEETKKAIEVMQAFVDGKEIQFKEVGWSDVWSLTRGPFWSWEDDAATYRIKPGQPKEIWVNEYDDCWGTAYGTKEEAEDSAGRRTTRKAVRYREVIEE